MEGTGASIYTTKEEEELTPLCSKFGQPPHYYLEYDCFWCESCQNYVVKCESPEPSELSSRDEVESKKGALNE